MTFVLDLSWARPDPVDMKNSGAVGVLMYTGSARPDPDYIQAILAQGLSFTFIQESDPRKAPEGGYMAGVLDAQYADRRADEVGYPRECSIAYVVSDQNASQPGAQWELDNINAYARGIIDTAVRPTRIYYGNRQCVDAAHSADGYALTWVPRTWNAIEWVDALIQEPNIQSPVDGTDYNSVFTSNWGQWGGGNVVTPPPNTGGPVIIKIGDTGDAVVDWQNFLNSPLGGNAGLVVDGDFGPATKQAVINFQSYFGKVADGIIGQETIDLRNYLEAQPAPAPEPPVVVPPVVVDPPVVIPPVDPPVVVPPVPPVVVPPKPRAFTDAEILEIIDIVEEKLDWTVLTSARKRKIRQMKIALRTVTE